MYKTFIRPLLFRMNPERAHAFTFSCLKALQKMPFGLALASLFFRKKDPRLEREVFGIKFPSPVGVAAGLDKDAGSARCAGCARIFICGDRNGYPRTSAGKSFPAPVPSAGRQRRL